MLNSWLIEASLLVENRGFAWLVIGYNGYELKFLVIDNGQL